MNFRKNSDILLIVLIGLVLRAKDILKYDFWFDEAFTGILAQADRQTFLTELDKDIHPPLYSLMVRAWASILGANDLTLRLLPLLFGILTIYFTYAIAKNLFNKETGSIAAFLVAISPFTVGYSLEARSYSFYGLVTVLTFYFLLKLIQTQNLKNHILFVLGLILMLAVHYAALVFIVPLLAIYAWNLYKSKNFKFLPVFVPFVGFLGYTTLQAIQKIGLGGVNASWIRESSLVNIPRSLISYLFGVKVKLPGVDEINDINFIFTEQVWGAFLLALFAVGVGFMVAKQKNDFKKLIEPAEMVFVPQLIFISLGLLIGQGVYVERYLFPAAIFFFIIAAFVLTSLLRFEIMAFVGIFYIFLLTQIVTPNYYIGMKDLRQNLRNYDNEIVFTSPQDFIIAKYYFYPGNNLRLEDPRDPEATYYHWPLIYIDVSPQNYETAIYVTPDEGRMTNEFDAVDVSGEYGSYRLYTRKVFFGD